MLYNENAIVWDHICCCMNFPLIFVLSREGDTAARSNGSTTARHCFPPRKAAASIPCLHSRYIHIISLDLYYITTCSTWFNKFGVFTTCFYDFCKNRHFDKILLFKSLLIWHCAQKLTIYKCFHFFTNNAECGIILLYNC